MGLCEVGSAKIWTKTGPNHVAKTMFFLRTLPKKQMQKPGKLNLVDM